MPVSVATTALILVVVTERISEYLMKLGTIAFNFVLSLFDKPAPERIAPPDVKLILVTLMNFAIYYFLFGYDFVSEPFMTIGIHIDPLKAQILSAVLVSGGSNLVHEFFGFFKNNRP